MIRPLSFFGQIVPSKRVPPATNPYPPPTSTPLDPILASVIPRPHGLQHLGSDLRQSQKQNRDSSGKSPYHYRKRSYVETPIQSPLGTPFATMAGFGLAERFDTDQRPTDLSPQTQKLLIDAIARPISVVTTGRDCHRHLRQTYYIDYHAMSCPSTPCILNQR